MSRSVGADTSVLIAAMCSWHEAHVACGAIVGELLAEDRLVVAAHSLLEAYSVLTRLPAPHRLSENDARTLLERNLRNGVDVVPLSTSEHWKLLARCPPRGIRGGRVYDALIGTSLRRRPITRILTLNPTHFSGLWDDDLPVEVP